MKIQHLSLGFAVTLAAASSTFAVPQSASMSFDVSVTAIGGSVAGDSQTTSWLGTPAGLSLSASATANDPAGAPNTAFADGSATWAADGNSGTVNLAWGWNVVDATEATTNGAVDWRYVFQADVTGWFEMSYAITGSGNTFGLNGVLLTDNFDSSVGAPVTNGFDPTTSGVFFGGVTAGNIYTVELSNWGNFGSTSYSANTLANGVFTWTIHGGTPAVPDASSTVVLIGVAFAGLCWVRRRTRV